MEISEPPKASPTSGCSGSATPRPQQDGVEAGDAEQAQTDHQQAGDGAAAEGDLQGGIQSVVGGLRGAHVGAHRDVHADVAGQPGEHRADGEADGGGYTDEDPDDHQQHDPGHADGGVLPVQVGLGAFLNCGGDFLHAVVAGGLGRGSIESTARHRPVRPRPQASAKMSSVDIRILLGCSVNGGFRVS